MKKKAIYPGTFDPITYGHIDVIKKALKIVDHVVVAISDGNNKNYLFDIDERIEIVISTNKGRVIRCAVKEIRVAGRNTQGVRIIKLSGDEKVVSATKIDDNLL